MTSPTKEEQEKHQHHHDHHHQWIYEETAEMSDLLGINTPQIKIVGVDLDAGEEIGEYDEYSGQHSKGLAYKAEHKIIIRPTRSPWRALSINSTRFTIELELLHLEYTRLRHGVEFDKRTKVLVEKWK